VNHALQFRLASKPKYRMNTTINVTKSFVESNIARLESCFNDDDYDWNQEIQREIDSFNDLLNHGSCWIGNTRYVLSSFTTKGFGFPV